MKNETSSIIKKLEDSNLTKSTIYVGLPISMLKDLTKKEVFDRIRNPKNNLFKGTDNHYEEIEFEKKRLLTDFKNYIENPLMILNYKDSNIGRIIEDYNNWLIRLNRLQMVYTPTYYKSILKKGVYEYDKIKIVWIDENGVKNQNTTRTYGHTGEENLRDILEKFLIENEKAKNPRYLERINVADGYFKSDLTVQIDNEEWMFEFKINNKTDYITELVRRDLWILYKEKYKID